MLKSLVLYLTLATACGGVSLSCVKPTRVALLSDVNLVWMSDSVLHLRRAHWH